jgi:predicted TPR repeat methyltransferase
MLTTAEAEIESPDATSNEVMLADGNWISLEAMSAAELSALQWEQEQHFARVIAELPKNSHDRAVVTGQAYDTVCTIFAAQRTGEDSLVMGLDKRYMRLVLDLLHRQINQGIGRPRLFEIGYGSGTLLKEISDHGFPVAGVEISSTMREHALSLLSDRHADRLLFGDLRKVSADDLAERPTLVYWNDVFEHICPDEISDYLSHIYALLQTGGMLVTITPNWLLRPSDITRSFCPLRTEARGLHFKEYRLAEVDKLLKQAGFRRVATPLVVSRKKIYLCGAGLRIVKQWCEPLIDRMPIKPAHLLCRGLGLSYTIATK